MRGSPPPRCGPQSAPTGRGVAPPTMLWVHTPGPKPAQGDGEGAGGGRRPQGAGRRPTWNLRTCRTGSSNPPVERRPQAALRDPADPACPCRAPERAFAHLCRRRPSGWPDGRGGVVCFPCSVSEVGDTTESSNSKRWAPLAERG